MYMVYLSYMYVYSVISTACERGLGCLVGWLPGRAAGGYFENMCVGYKVPCRYRCIGERVTQLQEIAMGSVSVC